MLRRHLTQQWRFRVSRLAFLLGRLHVHLRQRGLLPTLNKLGLRLIGRCPSTRSGRLRIWYEENLPSSEYLAAQRARVWPADAPLITLIAMARSNREADWAVRQLTRQTYGRWQLVLVVPSHAQFRRLAHGAMRDPRVLFVAAANELFAELEAARRQAAGAWIGVIDAADVLAPHALAEMANQALQRTCDVMYCDEDRVQRSGRRHELKLKPGWSPEMLLGFNYIGRLCLVRNEVLASAGGFDSQFGEAQEYEAILRVTEQTSRVERVAQCLYSRRLGGAAQSRSLASLEEHALRSHLRRRGYDAKVVTLPGGMHRATWPLSRPPLVSIIIPTLNNAAILRQCVEDLRFRTDYPRKEIILVDNNSTESEVLAYYAELVSSQAARIIPYRRPFNYSQACNLGAREARGELLLFLNNDISVIEVDWLTEMVRFALLPGVGCVGTKLLYPDGMVQHAGLILGIHLCGMIYNRVTNKYTDEFGSPNMYRNLLAVMGACQMVSRSAFDAVGGFDENYQIAKSDSILCLRLHRAGWRTVYTPHAALIHHEGYTRGKLNPIEDLRRAARDVRLMGYREDPYYHPALSSLRTTPTLRLAPEISPCRMLARQLAVLCGDRALSQTDMGALLSGRINTSGLLKPTASQT